MHWVVSRETVLDGDVKSTFVAVSVAEDQFQCTGPKVSRGYMLQISSDSTFDGRYVLVNPTAY